MFKGTSYIVIILLLLIQLISCLPRSSSSDSVASFLPGTTTITPSVGENAVPSGLNRFEEALLKGFINILNFCLQRTNQIAKDVLADPSTYSIDSEAMQKELSLLRKYVTDSNEALNNVLLADQFDSNTLVSFVNDTRNVVGRFFRLHYIENDPLTLEEQVIWNALNNGLREYNKEFDKRMNEYISNLVDEFERNVKTLSVAEKEKDKDMKDMISAWNAYTKIETSKTEFGKRLLQINLKL